jgi:hypothetical protein
MTGALLCLLLQQIDPAALQKAMAADAAAKGASPPAAQAAPAGGASPLAAAPALGAPASPAEGAAGLISAEGDTPPAASGWAVQENARAPGSSLLNPALSFILDTSFGYYGQHTGQFDSLGLRLAGDDPSESREGFGVQEVEVAAQAAIDPYLEGAVFLTIPNLNGIEVEEAYLVTTSLPFNLQIKAGTFRSQIGRNNTQHLHLQSFTRRPLMTALLFGPDGLRGPGAQASVLLPLPWFATLYAESFSIGQPDADDLSPGVSTFGGGVRLGPSNLTYTAELEQFWAPGESHSVFLGLNFATGRSFNCLATTTTCLSVDGARSFLYGGDLYYKWKPPNVSRTYLSLQWTTEFFVRALADGGPTTGAGYSDIVLQFARRFYLGGRFDLVGAPGTTAAISDDSRLPRRYGYAASLTFAPSEFSRIRLYGQELTGPGVPNTTVGFLQAEYSIGAHGAHPF